MHLSQLTTDFDWLPVVACTGLAFGLGALWYSRVLFGKVWMQEVGLTEEAVGDANMGLIFGGTIVLQLLVVTALSALLGPGSDWLTGLQTGLWIGLFWIATAYGITYLFEQRPLRLWLINAGYYVVLFAIDGAVLGAWR